MTDEERPIFERGDVVYDHGSFKGEQYLALTLTSKSWMDSLIDIPRESRLRGGVPGVRRIVPWGVQSIDHDDIDFWQVVVTALSSTRRLLPSSKNYTSGDSLIFHFVRRDVRRLRRE